MVVVVAVVDDVVAVPGFRVEIVNVFSISRELFNDPMKPTDDLRTTFSLNSEEIGSR